MATKDFDAEEYSNSSSDSSEEEEEEGNAERISNPVSKWRRVSIANASDSYLWIGVESEREAGTGGQKYGLRLPGVIGVEFKGGKKEHEFISRIPWTRSQPHRVATVKYHTDKIWGAASRLMIIHADLKIPLEIVIKGGESVIVTPDGCLKYATKKKIVPVDTKGKDLDKKNYSGNYREERERQQQWVPMNEYGKVIDIILEPHLRRGIINSKDCKLCQKSFQAGPTTSNHKEIEIFQVSRNEK